MIKKCLFPAAGYGTCFLSATKATPKEILPILKKPLIQYGVEDAFTMAQLMDLFKQPIIFLKELVTR